MLTHDLAAEDHARSSARSHSFRAALRNPVIYIFAAVYFAVNCAAYGLVLWLPSLIAATGAWSVFELGLLSAIPNVVGVAGILLLCRHSDATTERRWHFLACTSIGALALLTLTVTTRSVPLTILALSVAVIVIYSLLPIFWATPHAFLTGSAAAGGLALISSIGQLAGFVSPYVMGLTKAHTASFNTGLSLMAIVLLLGGLAMAFVLPWKKDAVLVGQGGRP